MFQQSDGFRHGIKIFRQLTKKKRYSPYEPGTEPSEDNSQELLQIDTVEEFNYDNSSDPCALTDDIETKSELKDPFELHSDFSCNSGNSPQWDRKDIELSKHSQSIGGSERKFQCSSEYSHNSMEDEFEKYIW
ncbi:hypothetical protein ACJJTC_006533 [Scirpophaga incertulas]